MSATAPSHPVATSALPLPLHRRGKVRDVYEVDSSTLLLVATDRVSAFDVVMREAVPHKGAVLTQLTAWWLGQLADIVPHHMISADANGIIERVPSLAPHRRMLHQRAMLVVRTNVYPVECVIRGYLAGSAWQEYRASGTLAGEAMSAGLTESARLERPLFSPATKAESGHDENITPAHVASLLGAGTARELERLSQAIYERGRATAEPRGIILADTKFEFGERDGRIVLIDEVMTPDSSRFWPADAYAPGRSQPSFDKQPLRDWLAHERDAGRWNGNAPPPALPDDVVRATSERYLDAFRRLTGSPLDTGGAS
ncbi:MAG TPA: phosphoribosylaminoimidazolesuccinocarboxamide synthase [Gemmatimonadaceae bacterium]|nr:phosphoribosylaminoimidazolesuccinocarboxamide synthase [Gemmatimonadaceae bacterium]